MGKAEGGGTPSVDPEPRAVRYAAPDFCRCAGCESFRRGGPPAT
jgi:hypothetical protein